METYAYSNDSFYRVEVDAQGKIVGVPVEVDGGEAVRSLIDNYLNHDLVTGTIAPGGTVTDKAPTAGEFANGVPVPIFNAVIERNDLTFQQKMDLLHRAFGDSPVIVDLARQYLGEDVAGSIWGIKATRYGANSASPDTPTPSPANVVSNAPMTQGTGPLPSRPAAEVSTPEPNVCSPADAQGPETAYTPRADAKTGGDPVILFTGQFFYQVTDLAVPGRGLNFRLTRTYLHQTRYRGPLGYSWDHSYNLWLREEQEVRADGTLENAVYRSNGQVRDDRYVQITQAVINDNDTLDTFANVQFQGPNGFFDRLAKVDGTYVLELVSGVRFYYNADLLAERIADSNGNEMRLSYDVDLRLIQVRDPVGKRFTFTYDEINRLRVVRDEEGRREIRYTYGDNGDLISMDVAPDDEEVVETDYDYLGPDVASEFQHNLIRVTNSLAHAALEVSYGTAESEWDYNRVVWQRNETGEFEYEYRLIIDGSDSPADLDLDPINFPRIGALVRDRRGHIVEHRFNLQGNVVDRREAVLRACDNRLGPPFVITSTDCCARKRTRTAAASNTSMVARTSRPPMAATRPRPRRRSDLRSVCCRGASSIPVPAWANNGLSSPTTNTPRPAARGANAARITPAAPHSSKSPASKSAR